MRDAIRIRAAVLREQGGSFEIEDLELNPPDAGEVLIEIEACGICHTDLMIRDGGYPTPLPVVLGHEGAGLVRAVGEGVRTVAVGDKVLMSYAACGQCASCHAGEPAYCWHHMEMNFSGYRYRDGQWTAPSALAWPKAKRPQEDAPIHGAFFQQSSFATHAVATEENVVRVPPDTDLSVFAPLGCGFQTGAGAILNTLRPRFGAGVVVYGVGNVGLAAIAAARSEGAGTIVAVEPNKKRHRLARTFGADLALPPEAATADALKERLGGGADICLDTTGRPQVLRAAVDVLAPRGVAGLIGGSPLGTEASIDMTHLLFGRTVRGILQGDSRPKDFLPKLIELHRRGQFPIEKLIRTYPLADINQAVEDMESGKVVKPVIVMTGQTTDSEEAPSHGPAKGG